jgi:hypothetical protein
MKTLLSKIEFDFLRSLEGFADYRRVLGYRINSKVYGLREKIELLQKCGFSATENYNGVTEFSSGQENQKSPNQDAIGRLSGASGGIWTRDHYLTKMTSFPFVRKGLCFV